MRRLNYRLTFGRHDRGFSFIELLAYMAIAALLILAAIPQFNQYRQKAVVSNEQNDVHNASLAAEAANINTASKHTGSGVRLASAHLTAATYAAAFQAISDAVAKVKTSDGTTLTTSDEGSGEYLITGTNAKAPKIAVVYASSTTTTPEGVTVPSGTTVIQDGSIVGGGSAAATPSASPTAAGCSYYTLTDGAPAATYDQGSYFKDDQITMRADFLDAGLRWKDSTTSPYPTGLSGMNQSNSNLSNIRVYVGDKMLCVNPLAISANITVDDFDQANGYYSNLHLNFFGAGEPLVGSDLATSHSDITMSFDLAGSHNVAKFPWNSGWDQGSGDQGGE